MKNFTALVLVPVILVSIAGNSLAAGKLSAAEKGSKAVTEKLIVAPAGSKVSFVGSKLIGKHDGGFAKFDGSIELSGGMPEEGQVRINIDTASIFTDTEKLTGHLKSADFFDVEKFPKASFVSKNIRPSKEEGSTHIVTGELELHGVRKTIFFPATIRITAGEVVATSHFSINRKDFGLNYPGMPDNLIKDDVVIGFEVHAERKAASAAN